MALNNWHKLAVYAAGIIALSGFAGPQMPAIAISGACVFFFAYISDKTEQGKRDIAIDELVDRRGPGSRNMY